MADEIDEEDLPEGELDGDEFPEDEEALLDDEVAGDDDEIGALRVREAHRLALHAPRCHTTEVQVGEVRAANRPG